jgi:hypothetical protein
MEVKPPRTGGGTGETGRYDARAMTPFLVSTSKTIEDWSERSPASSKARSLGCAGPRPRRLRVWLCADHGILPRLDHDLASLGRPELFSLYKGNLNLPTVSRPIIRWPGVTMSLVVPV